MEILADEGEMIMVLYYIWKKMENSKKKRKRRSMWVRELFLHREQEGEFFVLYPKLLRDPEKFQNYYRMTKECFEKLVFLIKPHFHIGHTNCRKSIGFLERLTVTIR